jgi:hypothetical protein
VNLFFLFEGKRTEPRVYRNWLSYAFPSLTRVERMSEIIQNNYRFLSGNGYPAMLDRIDEVIRDIEEHGAIDHFFICLDAGDDPRKRLAAIEKQVAGRLPNTMCHIVIANCCIETWFLGNDQMMPQQPQRSLLQQFKAFYDVSAQCPEAMPLMRGQGRTQEQFHKSYLRELLRENGHSYSEQNPYVVRKKDYFDAMIQRHDQTKHIQTFGKLLSIWRSLGSSV